LIRTNHYTLSNAFSHAGIKTGSASLKPDSLLPSRGLLNAVSVESTASAIDVLDLRSAPIAGYTLMRILQSSSHHTLSYVTVAAAGNFRSFPE
jgi:hypothetical protein